jgi:hypothetical protein
VRWLPAIPRWQALRPQAPRREAPRRPAPRGLALRGGGPRREALRWEELPGKLAVGVVIGGAALGGLLSAATGRQPGLLLGLFLVASTVCAVLGVRPRAVYLVIPVPALAYMFVAMLTGMLSDQTARGSTAEFLLGAFQWIASGFAAITLASVIAIITAVVRWPRPPGALATWLAAYLERPR